MRVCIRRPIQRPCICVEIDHVSYDVLAVIRSLAASKHPLSAAADKLKKMQINLDNFLSESNAWDYLCEVNDICISLIRNGDRFLIKKAVVSQDSPYLSPIPKPPLMFGLAGNCPQTWRKEGVLIPNYPVGYVRPWRSLNGHMSCITLGPSVTSFRCAAELGVVIGKKAFQVSRSDAFSYVCGYTCVNDMIGNQWKDFAKNSNPNGDPTFEELLITSYCGRATDGFAPVGPAIASKDEVEDPYNLLMYTRQNDVELDRSYTNSMVVGIENTIGYLSQFMTLYPGTIIHMGTMGRDGITIPEDVRIGEDEYFEVEIESVGRLRTYFDDKRKIF